MTQGGPLHWGTTTLGDHCTGGTTALGGPLHWGDHCTGGTTTLGGTTILGGTTTLGGTTALGGTTVHVEVGVVGTLPVFDACMRIKLKCAVTWNSRKLVMSWESLKLTKHVRNDAGYGRVLSPGDADLFLFPERTEDVEEE